MREFSIIKTRILHYLELKGITKYSFYKATGIANGVLSQPNGISEDNLLKFLECYHDVNLDWLVRGEGPVLHIATAGTGHPAVSNTPGEVHDIQVPYGADLLQERNIRIPVRPLAQALSAEAAIRSGDTPCICLPATLLDEGRFCCFRIEDSAMLPTLHEGGYVVCRLLPRGWRQTEEVEDICVAALADGSVMLRRFRWDADEATALPDHPDRRSYPIVRLTAHDLRTLWKVEWYLTSVLSSPHGGEPQRLTRMEEELAALRERLDRILPTLE